MLLVDNSKQIRGQRYGEKYYGKRYGVDNCEIEMNENKKDYTRNYAHNRTVDYFLAPVCTLLPTIGSGIAGVTEKV